MCACACVRVHECVCVCACMLACTCMCNFPHYLYSTTASLDKHGAHLGCLVANIDPVRLAPCLGRAWRARAVSPFFWKHEHQNGLCVLQLECLGANDLSVRAQDRDGALEVLAGRTAWRTLWWKDRQRKGRETQSSIFSVCYYRVRSTETVQRAFLDTISSMSTTKTALLPLRFLPDGRQGEPCKFRVCIESEEELGQLSLSTIAL